MYPRSFHDPGGRRLLLPHHLDLLGAALQRLGSQTHADLARTLAETAARLVSEAVCLALADPGSQPSRAAWTPSRDPWGRRERGEPLMNVFDDAPRENDDDRACWEEEEDDFSTPASSIYRPRPLTPEIWTAELALGLRTAAWWLARKPGRSLFPALAVGAGTTLVAMASGPLTLAGLGLIEAMLSIKAAEAASNLASRLLARSRE